MDGGKVGLHYYPFVINQDNSDTDCPASTFFYVHHASAPFIIKNDGKVGIGTDAPATKLTIESDSTGESISDGLRLQNSHGVNNDISPIYFGVHGGTRRAKCGIGWKRTGSYGIGKLLFALDNNGDDADVSFANDTKITFQGDGNVGIGTDNPGHGFTVHKSSGAVNTPIAWIHNSGNFANYDGTVISCVNDGADAEVLHVRTNNTTYNGGTSLMLVRGDGHVGIGTDDPAFKLHVAGGDVRLTTYSNSVYFGSTRLLGYDSATAGNLWIIGGSGGASGSCRVTLGTGWNWDTSCDFLYAPGTYGAGTGVLSIGQQSKNNANFTHGITRFYTKGGERVRINADGCVGIGTNDPETRLHVEGSNYADSSIKMERSGSGINEDAGLIFSKSSAATDGHRLGGIYFGHSGTSYAMIRGEMDASTGGEVYIVAGSQTNAISNTSVKTLEITAGTTTIDGTFRPRLDSTYNLGQTSLRWSHLYVDAITCGGAISGTGASITSLSGTNISSGTVAAARLGSGSSITTKFLRGDNTWQTVTSGGGSVTSVAVTVGTGLDVSGSPITSSGTIDIDLDLSEFTDMTADITTSDEVILLDSGSERKKAFGELKLSKFNNDSGFLASEDYAIFQNVKSAGTASGGLTKDTWVKRTLQTTPTNNITNASLTSSVITLPAGTYYCKFWASGYYCGAHQARLRDTTSSVTRVYGSSELAWQASPYPASHSVGDGIFTLSGTTTLELQHIAGATSSTNGQGRRVGSSSSGDVDTVNLQQELYCAIEFWKL